MSPASALAVQMAICRTGHHDDDTPRYTHGGWGGGAKRASAVRPRQHSKRGCIRQHWQTKQSREPLTWCNRTVVRGEPITTGLRVSEVPRTGGGVT